MRRRLTNAEQVEARRLLDSNDALSTQEQDTLVTYLSDNNDSTNHVFLLCLCILHAIIGSVYLYLSITEDRSLSFLIGTTLPAAVTRMCMLWSSLLMCACAILLASYLRKLPRVEVDMTTWSRMTHAEKEKLASDEIHRLQRRYLGQMRLHAIAAALSVAPAAVFLREAVGNSDSGIVEFIAAAWQPFLHLIVRQILWWMCDSQLCVVRLLQTAYYLEKA